MHTESDQKIQLAFKFRIEKFQSARGDLWSEGVSASKVVGSRAVWKIHVDAKGDDRAIIYLDLVGPMRDNKESLEAAYHLNLVGKYVVVSLLRGTKVFKQGREGASPGSDYWVVHYIDRNVLERYLQEDGSLVIGADVEYPDLDESDLFSKWHESVSKLRETGAHSDCTLMVGGEQLKTHRNILSAISPTFEEMFGNEAYQESKDGIVRIEDSSGMLKDTSAKPYKALLSYAYTGCVDWCIYGDCKRDVLVVACKYLVFDLKHHVERLLADEITTESFIELAILADSYSCDHLKKACVKFLSSNCRAVVTTPQWDALTRTRLDLTSELLRLVREDETTATAADGGTK